MDKKQLLMKSLAKIMNISLPDIVQLVNKYPSAPAQLKADGTHVTQLDLALSDLIEKVSLEHFPNHIFYSEEKFSDWGFPLLAVDPLDGTREYIAGRAEWAISVANLLMENFNGEGWIFNPITNEKFDAPFEKSFVEDEKYYGEASRSEWERGLFKNAPTERFKISPMGSIAYKLGRLSDHKIDFVVSLQPKNIWDIAAGTILAKEAGYSFYSQGKKVEEVRRSYQPPLIWCHEKIFSELSQLFP